MKLGSEIKSVWITSVPRCGSTWTFNVTRALIQAAGLRPLPDLVPQTDKAMRMIAEAGLGDSSTRRVRVLKVHEKVEANTPKSLFISPHRNPADVLMSYMNFMKIDFAEALEVAKQAAQLFEDYATYPKDKLLSVDYGRIVRSPREVMSEICSFLDIAVPPNALDDCAVRFSKESVQAIIAKGRETDTPGVDEGRWYDVKTGFQSGHVTNYRDGAWRDLLTPEQRETVERELGAAIQSTTPGAGYLPAA